MGHKNQYLSSLLVTCHQSSRLYGVYKLAVGLYFMILHLISYFYEYTALFWG